MKLSIRLMVASVAALAIAAPALAQGFPQPTPEERAASFDKADANKDGKLDLAEFKSSLPEQILSRVGDDMLPQILQRRDTDGDGFLSKAEFTAPMQRPGG